MNDQNGRPSDPNESLLLDHEYDGIREYDNPTPGWWHVIFFCSMVFAVGYFAVATWSPYYAPPAERVASAQAAEFKALFGSVGELEPDTRTLLTLMDDPKWVEVGKSLFSANCVSCHGTEAQGINGPNLTDDLYKNVKDVTDIFEVITLGAGKGAMPAWQTRISKNERVLLASYVASLRGRNLPGNNINGEKPIAPWPTLAPTTDAPAPTPSDGDANADAQPTG